MIFYRGGVLSAGGVVGLLRSWITELGNFFLLLQRAFVAAVVDRPRSHVLLDQLHAIGVRSLSIVNLTAVFTGMVMALQLGFFLSKFGAKIFVSRVVGLARSVQVCRIVPRSSRDPRCPGITGGISKEI